MANERTNLIDSATDALIASVAPLARSLAFFLTGWFAARFILEDGNIADTKENYDAINDIGQAQASFFSSDMVPWIAGIGLVLWDLRNLNVKYFAELDEVGEAVTDEITESLASAFGFTVTDETVDILPTGWLAEVGQMDSVYARVREAATKAVTARQPMVDFLRILKTEIEGDETITGLVRAHFRTIVHDVYAEYDRQVGYKYATALGYRAAIYEGGLIDRSRPFCIERNGKVFTTDEIKAFGTALDTYGGYRDKPSGYFDGKPKVGYDPFFEQGGYNCRHAYSYIPDRLAVVLRPELAVVWKLKQPARAASV